jgi:hypothetical protein
MDSDDLLVVVVVWAGVVGVVGIGVLAVMA